MPRETCQVANESRRRWLVVASVRAAAVGQECAAAHSILGSAALDIEPEPAVGPRHRDEAVFGSLASDVEAIVPVLLDGARVDGAPGRNRTCWLMPREHALLSGGPSKANLN